MPRPKSDDTLKIALRIAYGDRERLRKFFPSTPYNEVIRRLLTTYLDRLEAAQERRTPTVELPEPEI